VTLPLAAALAAVGASAVFLAVDFTGVLVGSLILFGGVSGIGPTLDSRTLETLGPERRSRYGEVRAFGSLAFVLSTLGIGFLLDVEGAQALFWVYVPFLVATAAVTAAIPRRPGGSTRSVNLLRGAGQFLAKSGVALLFVGLTVVWAALAAMNAFYSIQIVALGGSEWLVGIAWAFGAAIEVPLMYAFPRIGGRFGTERLVVVGAAAFALRALLASFATDPVALVLIGPLEGLGFACVFVGGVTVLAARAPAGLQGTAQGLFSASAGLATIIGSIGGGAVAGAVGIPGLFAVDAAFGLLGAALLALALLRPTRPGTDRTAAV
jgi:PPP family 3-phenylpropionic acid transporter